MELELKMQELAFCEKTQPIVASHEEAMEAAIPEYCPDIARVIDTVGQLKVREKKLSGGRLTVSGAVKVTVLYISEESAGLRSLILSVPFTCVIEDQRLQNCRSICAEGRLLLVEARPITARKLYVRVMPEFEIEGICQTQQQLCCDVAEEPSVQTRSETREVQLLTSVLERTFHFNQECMPEPGHGEPEDLLLERLHLCVTDCQRVSNKLIIRGEATVSVLYRTAEQDLGSCAAVLPFSQILDAAQLPENGVYCAEVWAEDSDVRLVRADGRVGFGVSARLGVMIKIYEKKTRCYISDLYSTRYETDVRCGEAMIAALHEPQKLRQEVTQQLEFGQGRPFACVTGLECGAVEAVPEGGKATLRTNIRCRLLYQDETGAPVSTERLMEVAVHLPQLPDSARAVCAPVVTTMGTNSCELRFPVDFFVESREPLQLRTIRSVEMSEPAEKEQPALVLRRARDGETLWDLAKAYRTAPDLVETANHMEPGDPLPHGLLLIPRMRG